MKAEEYLKLLREMRDVAFATVDAEGCPQVRIIDVMLVEGEYLYFCTARGKEFYRQLTDGGRVAITGLNKEFKMIRMAGRVEKLEDQKRWIDRIFEENPSMNGVYPGEARYILEPFRVVDAELEFFDLGHEPIDREVSHTGNAADAVKGFRITEGCVECGTCAAVCPQKTIRAGSPYEIDGRHCLHCGLCFEECPVGAIERL